MSLSDWAENAVLDALFNNTSLAVAANYVKLHTGDPGEDGTANAAGHTTRVAVSFGPAASGAVSNDAAVSFTSLTAAETITHISIWSASTGGNCLGSGALSVAKTVAIGDTLTFPTGDIDITLS